VRRFFLSFNERLVELYPSLFEGGEPTSFNRKWGNYASIYKLAGGQLEAFDRATERNVHECLMYLEYEVDKFKEENKKPTNGISRTN